MQHLSDFDIQRVFAAVGYYNGDIDGDAGPQTIKAALTILGNHPDKVPGYAKWKERRILIGAVQLVLKYANYEVGSIDGYFGPQTLYAFTQWNYRQLNGHESPNWRPDDEDDMIEGLKSPPSWGRQRDMDTRYGPAGGTQCTAGKVSLPFTMKIAWNKSQKINRFSCHEDVADSAERVYLRINSAYSPEQISEIGLDLFGGCYNYRKKRGGKTLSTHAYGLAIDFDPERNQLKWNKLRARLALPDAVEFWRCWEAEGWLSLGRARDFDWMHVQAVGL